MNRPIPPSRPVWHQPPPPPWPPYAHPTPVRRTPDGSSLILTLVCVFAFVTPLLVQAGRLVATLVRVHLIGHG